RRASVDPGAGPVRGGASGEACVPGAAHRGQPRARVARDRAPGGVRDAPSGRAPRGHQLPLARGPDSEALSPRPRERLHLPTRVAGVRLRSRARGARSHPQAGPAVGARDRPESPCELGAAARGGPHLMSTIAQAARAPRRRATTVASRRGWVLSGGLLWITLLAALLTGVVAINVAVLRLNLQLDGTSREQVDLQTDITRLRSEISSNAATTRIERLARGELGL